MESLNISNESKCSSTSGATYLDKFFYVWIISGVLTICVNVILIITIKKCFYLDVPMHKMLASLAIADCTVGIVQAFLTPFVAVPEPSRGFCIGMLYLATIVETVSGVTILLITIERFIAVTRPLRYHHLVTTKRVIIAITFSWVYSVLCSTTILTNHTWLPHQRCMYEEMVGTAQLLISVINIISCITPVSIIYIHMFFVARKHQRQISTEILVPQHRANSQLKDFREQLTLLKTSALIVGVYIGCWAMLFVLMTLEVTGFCTTTGGVAWGLSFTFVFSNSFLNFFLYAWRIKEFPETIKSTLSNKFQCNNPN